MFQRQVGSNTMKFLFDTGGVCDPGDSHENDVILYAKTEGRKEHFTLDTLSYSSYKVQMPTLCQMTLLRALRRESHPQGTCQAQRFYLSACRPRKLLDYLLSGLGILTSIFISDTNENSNFVRKKKLQKQ